MTDNSNVSDLERNTAFEQMRLADPENKACFECGEANPKWTSINLACFICLQCSGKHRGLGVHLSFVRSCTLDSWSPKQLRFLQMGGNHKLRQFLEDQKIPSGLSLSQKYGCSALELYRGYLKALVNGHSPDPVVFVGYVPVQTPSFAPKPMTGFGSGPIESQESSLCCSCSIL